MNNNELCPGAECRFYPAGDKDRVVCRYCTRYRFDCFTTNKTDSCSTCAWYIEQYGECTNKLSQFTTADISGSFCCDLWEGKE